MIGVLLTHDLDCFATEPPLLPTRTQIALFIHDLDCQALHIEPSSRTHESDRIVLTLRNPAGVKSLQLTLKVNTLLERKRLMLTKMKLGETEAIRVPHHLKTRR